MAVNFETFSNTCCSFAEYSSAKFFANKVFSILIVQASIEQFGMLDGLSEINLLSWHCLLWLCGIEKMFIHCHLCCLLADKFSCPWTD